MKTGKLLLPALLLFSSGLAPLFAQNFSPELLTARGITSTIEVPAVPAPVLELNGIGEDETAIYMADRESVMENPGRSLQKPAAVNLGGDGVVKFYHPWSKETLEIRYRDKEGRYIPEAMAKIKYLFRCRLTGKEMDIPAKLVELLDVIQEKAGGKTLILLCGYRSPEFNALLAVDSSAVAKNSLHMKGWAADIRIDGVSTANLRKIAASIKAGGVGYYPSDKFVHVDIGPIRYW